MNTLLLYPIVVPILIALACLLTPRQFKGVREALAILTALASVALSIVIFMQSTMYVDIPWLRLTPDLAISLDLRTSPFACLVLVAASMFTLLVGMYSLKYMLYHPRHNEYYAYFLAVLGMTAGVVLANNLIVLLFFWELNGFMLFLMAGLNGDKAVPSATKTLIITGFGDLSLLLGIGLLWLSSGTLTISELATAPQTLSGWLPTTAFLLIMVGAFVKAGAMPLHSWIPAIATTAPMTVMAYLPASLDKLLGIYLLARISLHLFVMTPAIGLVLMSVGAITILGAVLMALIQHDYRKMLAFHAVSQVGYMVMGIGTGVPVGVIGGLFHMLNHAIYKCCLFLCGGSVQHRTGRTEFSQLGGLAKAMPWTFAACLLAALAISGVPPMNGFVSKWLVYQGIIERGGALFPIFLVVAMFGSALTLASFMKLLYSIFWGDYLKELENVRESPMLIRIPLVVLALFCLAFGIFYRWPVDTLVAPILGPQMQVAPLGLWQSGLAAILMIMSLLAGLVIYWAGRSRRRVEADVFLGGEMLDPEIYRVPGTHFYGPVKAMNGLKQAYDLADRGALDFYLIACRATKQASHWVYRYIDQALAEFYQEVIPALFTLIGQILRALNARIVLTHVLWILYAIGFLGIIFMPDQYEVITLTRVVACIGMIGWAFLALVERNLIRMLVLAATSQLGFVVLGASISSGVAISYLLTGTLALVVLFGDVFIIRRRFHTTQLDQLAGLAGKMPWAFILFVLAALWLSGLPPFGSFFSKFLLGVAAGEISPFLTIAITGTAILTLWYLLIPIRRFLRAG